MLCTLSTASVDDLVRKQVAPSFFPAGGAATDEAPLAKPVQPGPPAHSRQAGGYQRLHLMTGAVQKRTLVQLEPLSGTTVAEGKHVVEMQFANSLARSQLITQHAATVLKTGWASSVAEWEPQPQLATVLKDFPEADPDTERVGLS